MHATARNIRRTYLGLLLANTLATSLIWGLDTLFLLDAGLSNFEVFIVNAMFSVGMLAFELPTGIIADIWGRRTSYLLGTVTLALSTVGYFILWHMQAPVWGFASMTLLLGLGYTFFSGAVEAWLVDALAFLGASDQLERILGNGQVIRGVAMLTGSVGGGIIAQYTSLGVPYIVRAAILLGTFVAAYLFMRDLGFLPDRTAARAPIRAMKAIASDSVRYGIRNDSIRWVMYTAPFTMSVSFYVFYAMQPYLLQLYGDPTAYSIAGLAAAIMAGSQIVGGMFATRLRRIFRLRTTALLFGILIPGMILLALGVTNVFIVAIILMAVSGAIQAAATPIRQAYLNEFIPSKQRATILSFDSLLGNAGGVPVQPALGKVADVHGYGASFMVGGVIQLLAIPLILKSRKNEQNT